MRKCAMSCMITWSVSYTHLDVYKRQQGDIANSMTKQLNQAVSKAQDSATTPTVLNYAVEGGNQGMEAVSYTHLDVYKRQCHWSQ